MALTPATEKALEENMEKYLDRIPLRRIAEPEEVADVAIFLVSPRAKYMTGTTVDISGGLLMH
jgi:3-oxoacyl-[acyl-carrier protein] reductase